MLSVPIGHGFRVKKTGLMVWVVLAGMTVLFGLPGWLTSPFYARDHVVLSVERDLSCSSGAQ